MMDVTITSGHVERVARALHGGAGPSGINSSHWRSFLLKYGSHCAIADLVMMIAKGVVGE